MLFWHFRPAGLSKESAPSVVPERRKDGLLLIELTAPEDIAHAIRYGWRDSAPPLRNPRPDWATKSKKPTLTPPPRKTEAWRTMDEMSLFQLTKSEQMDILRKLDVKGRSKMNEDARVNAILLGRTK